MALFKRIVLGPNRNSISEPPQLTKDIIKWVMNRRGYSKVSQEK